MSSEQLVQRRIGNYDLWITPAHIYNSPNLPKTYDYVPIALIMDAVRSVKNLEFVDIGANVGDTAALAKTAIPDLSVTCIEPAQSYFDAMEMNTANFSNMRRFKAIFAPKRLHGEVFIEANGQTGSTRFNDPAAAPSADTAGETDFVAPEDVFNDKSKNYLVKTDTDGFDHEILTAILDYAGKEKVSIPLYYFEGPSEPEMRDGQYTQWFDVFDTLSEQGYNMLILTNLGLPYVNAGKDAEVAKSALRALENSFKFGRPHCHYFDVVAYRDDVENAYLKLEENWPLAWQNT